MRLTIAGLATIAAAVVLSPSLNGSSSAQIVPSRVRCLHDAGETQVNRARREQALAVARAINTAEGRGLEQSGRFQPLAALQNIPAGPDGFTARLYADPNGYVLSLKDDRDVCRFAIFSDQSGTLYSSTPTVPQMASIER